MCNFMAALYVVCCNESQELVSPATTWVCFIWSWCPSVCLSVCSCVCCQHILIGHSAAVPVWPVVVGTYRTYQPFSRTDLFECFLLLTEEYHTQNSNVDQYVTLQQFKGCDIAQLLLSEDSTIANIELTDYYVLLAASHTGLFTDVVCFLFVEIT